MMKKIKYAATLKEELVLELTGLVFKVNSLDFNTFLEGVNLSILMKIVGFQKFHSAKILDKVFANFASVFTCMLLWCSRTST